MKRYCEECGKEVETKVVAKKEIYNVCGEAIEVNARVLVCADCGEEFYCEELDNETLLASYNEYRRRHKLLFPDEIKDIREQYGLSQRSFAKLLNWGDKTIRRYENGSIQDKSHNSLLVFLREPENMRYYLAENEVMLEERQKAKLIRTIDAMEQKEECRAGNRLSGMFFADKASIENGFKEFDYEKLCAMVLFFTHKTAEILKVKLIKLLNYSDMIYYQENGVSMSGSRYIHLPFGPVPQNYEMIFGMMEMDQIAHVEIKFDNGYEKHQVIPDCELREGELTPQEMEVLERVYSRFENFGSAEISNYSHREKGYRSTKQGEIISYAYAKDIRLE
ncbi:MAG: DUF4065 domain-containing protein [Lachnospiraceae bacterium]|nr:DUF4065 domain-containing protein [Lachnospiraceae bacterium]